VPDDGTGSDILEKAYSSDFTRPYPKRVTLVVPHPEGAVCAAVTSNVNVHDEHEADTTPAPTPANERVLRHG